MQVKFSSRQETNIPKVLSSQRFRTYLQACHEDVNRALELYHWNLSISAEFLKVMHIYEVALRNSVADAIERTYGPRWPWLNGFRASLSNRQSGYSPRNNLEACATRFSSTDKIISELKFVFWERMLTTRYQERLWDEQLRLSFPNLDIAEGLSSARDMLRREAENIRKLRNRLAHHEPIFARANLREDFRQTMSLIQARCRHTAASVEGYERVSEMLTMRESNEQN